MRHKLEATYRAERERKREGEREGGEQIEEKLGKATRGSCGHK